MIILENLTQFDCVVNRGAYPYSKEYQKFLFIDLDGTIRYGVDNTNPEPGYAETYKVRPPFKKEEVKVFPNIPEKLLKWREKDYRIIGITNQSGVEEGAMTYERCKEICIETSNQIGFSFPIIFAPCKKMNTSIINLRKPNIGMITLAQKLYGIIDKEKSLLVGDYKTDIETGEKAGLKTFKVFYELEGFDFPLP